MLNTLHPGKVQETTRATRVEAFSGRDNRKYMTPLRTKQVVDWVVDDSIEAAIETAKIELDDVLSVASANLLPNPGASGKIYIVGKLAFYWNGTGYDQISVENSDRVPEGTTNLYFTNSRAKSALAENLLVIETQINGKAETLHNHAISEVTGLFSELDGKQPAGSYAPADHVHPFPTPADIGAAPASGSNPDVANSALGLYDSPNGWDALKIYDSHVILAGEEFDLGGAPDAPTALKRNFRAAIDTVRRVPNGDAPDSSQGYVDQAAQLWDTANDATALSICDGAVDFGPHAENTNVAANFRNAIGAAPASDSNPDVANSALELRDNEDTGGVALKCDGRTNDRWSVLFPDSFRAAIGAATAAQGAKADTSLQQGAYISAASLEVGSIAAGQAPDLYVGQNGKVGIGTEGPTEKLTVAGNIDLLEGQVKNLGTPVDDTDAATKGFVDTAVAGLQPAGSYATADHTHTAADIGAVPNIDSPTNPVARAAVELRTEEGYDQVALKYAVENDSWQVHDPDNFRQALGAALADHTHSASDIRTTVVRAQIPQGDLLFYFDSSASPYNDRPIYRTPSGYTLWFNSTNETWNISENLLFFEEENILLTSDEDNRQHPWEAAWTHDITLATLADYTQEAFKTWASKNDLLNLKNRFASLAPASIGAATAAQGAKADGAETLLNNLRDPSKELADWTVQRAYALWDDSDESRTLQFSGYDENASVFIREDYIAPFRTRLNLATTIDVSEVNDKIDNEIHWRGVAISQLQTQVDNLIPQVPTTGTYTLRSVDGIVSWVEPDYKATYEEAISATSNDRWMTPLLVSQLINLRDDVLDFSLKSQFPATGEKGRIYMAGSIAYLWTGDTYEKVSRDSVFNSASQPTDPQDGDRWIDSTTFIAYEYFGGNWIQTAV